MVLSCNSFVMTFNGCQKSLSLIQTLENYHFYDAMLSIKK